MNEYISPHDYRILMIPWMISSILSMIGSLTIIISSMKRFYGSMYQRLIGIISICDLIVSINYILNPILVPSYASTNLYGWLWASGTSISCTITGIIGALIHLIMTCYTLGIMLFFYSKVKYNISEQKLQKLYEKTFHIIVILFSIIIVTLVSYYVGVKPSPAYYVCFPSYCELGDMENCKFHFDDVKFLFSLLYGISVSTMTTLSLIALYMIYKTVNDTKKRVQDRYERQLNSSSNMMLSQEMSTYSMNNNNNKASSSFDNINNDNDNNNNNTNRNINIDNNTANSITNYNNINDNHNTNNSSSRSSFFNNIRRSISTTTAATMNHNQRRRKEKDRKLMAIRNQAILYMIIAFNATFSIWLVFILQIIQSYTYYDTTPTSTTTNDNGIYYNNNESGVSFLYLKMIAYIMLPIQGFLNFLVYTRPRYLEYRKLQPHNGRFYAFHKAISLKPCPLYTTYNHNNNHHNQQQHASSSSHFFNTIKRLSSRSIDPNVKTTLTSNNKTNDNKSRRGGRRPNHNRSLHRSHSNGSSSSSSSSSVRRDDHDDHNDNDRIGQQQQQEIWKLPNDDIQIVMTETNNNNNCNNDNKSNNNGNYMDSISSSCCHKENELHDDNIINTNNSNINNDVHAIHDDSDSDSIVVIEFIHNDDDNNSYEDDGDDDGNVDTHKNGVTVRSAKYTITIIDEQVDKVHYNDIDDINIKECNN